MAVKARSTLRPDRALVSMKGTPNSFSTKTCPHGERVVSNLICHYFKEIYHALCFQTCLSTTCVTYGRLPSVSRKATSWKKIHNYNNYTITHNKKLQSVEHGIFFQDSILCIYHSAKWGNAKQGRPSFHIKIKKEFNQMLKIHLPKYLVCFSAEMRNMY